MKIIAVVILIAIGIVTWALINPDQQENILAVKEAIGIDSNNPYATKMRKVGEKQQSIADALDNGSSSLDGARLPDKLIATQEKIMNEFKAIVQGLEREGGDEELILEIEDSRITADMHFIKSQLRDGKLPQAAERSRKCALQMEAWANELDGSD